MLENRRVFVVDDDPAVADLLVEMVAAIGAARCASTNEAETALIEMVAFHPDVAIIDVYLGGGVSGIELCRSMRCHADLEQVGILLISGLVTRGAEATVFEAGADNFMNKAELTPRLLAGVLESIVRRVPKRRLPELGPLRLSGDHLELDGRAIWVTDTERRIVATLAEHAGTTRSASQLLPDAARVKFHVCNLRRKLGSYAWIIETVRGSGYRLVASRPSARTKADRRGASARRG